MKKVLAEIKNRWKSETPIFFKTIVRVGVSISGVALAMHLAMVSSGAIEPQWWIDIYPYVIAIPAGMAATAKFTQEYDENGKPKRKEKK